MSDGYSISEMEAQLRQAREAINQFQSEIPSIKQERDSFNDELAEIERKKYELKSKQRDLDNQLFEIQKSMRGLEDVVKRQSVLLSQAKENERVKAEYDRLTVHFNEAAKQYEWYKNAFPHQIEGAKQLAIAERGILGDKRGLGKTLTSIAWTDLVKSKKVLAFVPGDVMENFLREIRHWAPHRQPFILGGKSKAERAFIMPVIQQLEEVFVIANYTGWRRDKSLIDELVKCQFDTIIADEAHELKNMSTVAYSGVEAIAFADNQCYMCQTFTDGASHCKSCGYEATQFGEFRSVKYILPMTGTPILNKPQDFFPLLHLVDPVTFADKYDYLEAYCTQTWDGKWKFKAGGLNSLTKKLAGKYIARDRKSAGIKIPKQEIQYYNLELDATTHPRQVEAYKILNQKAALVMDDMFNNKKSAKAVLYAIALITRQRQMMTWPAGIEFDEVLSDDTVVHFKCDIEESIKVDRVIERYPDSAGDYNGLIPELVAEGERVVLFSQFKPPLKELERRLNRAGITCVRYDGDTPKHIADEVTMDFDRKYIDAGKEPKWQVVLANYRKGGVGLNFTDATQMIILDEEWGPGKVDQAYGRIDRIGQTEETTVHVLRVDKTIDTWMQKLIEHKQEMINGFESSMDLANELYNLLKFNGMEQESA